MPLNTRVHTTLLQVRPDDIDLFGHVHSSRYMDYVFAARLEQMEMCYGMPLQEFMQYNLGWYLSATEMRYLKPLKLGDSMKVQTAIVSMGTASVRVEFAILRDADDVLCCKGWAEYVMVDLQTGRPRPIPEWIINRYSLPDDSIS
jgi:acyl-CoA thioester hydrolase/thioesterase-3